MLTCVFTWWWRGSLGHVSFIVFAEAIEVVAKVLIEAGQKLHCVISYHVVHNADRAQ